jgi:hypothetical protein
MLAVLAATTVMAQSLAALPDDIGTHTESFMRLYRRRDVKLDTMNTNSPDDSAQPSSFVFDNIGHFAWSIEDVKLAGKPCKLYKTESIWKYKKDVKQTAMTDYHIASVFADYWLDLDGNLVRSVSNFKDEATVSAWKFVTVEADYGKASIKVKTIRDGVLENQEFFPVNFEMDACRSLFTPMLEGGLVKRRERLNAVVHPYTGLPYRFLTKVRGRFEGHFFLLPQEGYWLEVEGSEGTATPYVTRQGQLIRVDLPDKFDAYLEVGPLYPERYKWGKFDIQDWNKPAWSTNPDRPKYKTLITPVLLNNPRLLMPVPSVLAR